MTKKAARGSFAALARRYLHRAEEIRTKYVAAARTPIKAAARAAESLQSLFRRQFVKDVAKAKRKGLLSSETDARTARLTAQMSRRLGEVHSVLEGKTRAVKVKPKVAKKLRQEGYQVVNDRVLLGERFTVRKGEVYEKRGKVEGAQPTKVRLIRLTANVDAQVDALLATLKPGEYIGFEVGAGFSKLFDKYERDELLNWLAGHDSFNRDGMKYLMVHKIQEAEALDYIYARERERQRYTAERREYRRARRRTRRSKKRGGLRTERGH